MDYKSSILITNVPRTTLTRAGARYKNTSDVCIFKLKMSHHFLLTCAKAYNFPLIFNQKHQTPGAEDLTQASTHLLPERSSLHTDFSDQLTNEERDENLHALF